MLPLRVVIVDDEPVARRGLRNLLGAPDVVVGEAHSGPDAVAVIDETQPDLVLLDIQIPEFDGFEVLRRLQGPLPAVVFVTAYDAYAVRAFETHALDYLVKPVHSERFITAVERARERLHTDRMAHRSQQLHELLHKQGALQVETEKVERLIVPHLGADMVLEVGEVEWIEADDYYAAVHARGKRYLLRESLDSLERRLASSLFVRVHRSAIVNLRAVAEVRVRVASPVLVLRTGARVPLSRRRREQVETALRRLDVGSGVGGGFKR
jgi:two-component system LytT family response regulator